MKKVFLVLITLLTLCACKQGGTSRLTRQEMRDKLAYRSASSLGQDRANGSTTNNFTDSDFEDNRPDDINYDQKVYTIMAGVFSTKEAADQILIRARNSGYDGKVIMDADNQFTVHLAHSNDREQVKAALDDLQSKSIAPKDAFITVEK